MWALLASIDEFIEFSFNKREFNLRIEIMESTTCRFQEELEAIFDAIDRKNSLKNKVSIFGLGTSTS